MEHIARGRIVRRIPSARCISSTAPASRSRRSTSCSRHGVRSALEYARSGDLSRARAISNPDLAPHLSFVDMGGHGYAVVRASEGSFACELVCLPRPIERSDRPDGGALVYSRRPRGTRAWKAGDRPKLETTVLEGDPSLSTG